MDLNIFIVLLFSLFTAGHSLKCYECANVTGSCVSKEKTCSSDATICTSGTLVTYAGNTNLTLQARSCDTPQNCLNGSINFGIARTTFSMQCCNTDLCNKQNLSDVSSNSPFNGKQCYTCKGQDCMNKLDCLGNEDYCIKAAGTFAGTSGTVKGCVSKSICDITSATSQVTQGLVDVSCCQGNLCNSAESITHNFLLLSWLLFSYILFH